MYWSCSLVILIGVTATGLAVGSTELEEFGWYGPTPAGMQSREIEQRVSTAERSLMSSSWVNDVDLYSNEESDADSADENESEIVFSLEVESIKYPRDSNNDALSSALLSSDRQSVAELQWSRRVTFSNGISAFTDLSAVSEMQETIEVADHVNSNRIEANQLWLSGLLGVLDPWESGFSVSTELKLGLQGINDDHGWWWDENLLGVGFNGQSNHWQYKLFGGREVDQLSTETIAHDPEKKSVYWILGSLHFDLFESFRFSTFLTHKFDQSSRPTSDGSFDEDRFDEYDDALSWLGGRVEHRRQTSFGVLGFSLDAALLRGLSERVMLENDDGAQGLEVEEEESVVGETPLVDDTTQLNVVDVSSVKVFGWALDTRLFWELPFLAHTTLQLGFATGSGTDSDRTDRSQTFRQTGIHSNELDHHAYSDVLEPELANLQVYSAAIEYSITHYGSVSIRYHRLRTADLSNRFLDTDLDLEATGLSRKIGDEWSLGWQIHHNSGLELNANLSRFKLGAGVEDFNGKSISRAELAVAFEF